MWLIYKQLFNTSIIEVIIIAVFSELVFTYCTKHFNSYDSIAYLETTFYFQKQNMVLGG